MREAYQKILLNVNISWEPGSQVPSEFAALGLVYSKQQIVSLQKFRMTSLFWEIY